MNRDIQTLKDWVHSSQNIVFFGGAGVSTESGIPDFRGTDGLYQQTYAYPPEIMLSHDFLYSHPEDFFQFYRDKMVAPWAKPNNAHKGLAELEKKNKLRAVVTQNIDGLHQMAGSHNVLELHGSVHRNYCTGCGKTYDLAFMLKGSGVPKCEACGKMVRPDVVLYGEALNASVIDSAVSYLNQADILIVGGTSLVVYPAASLVNYYRGSKLVLVNKDRTSMDSRADLVLSDAIGEVFQAFLPEE